MAIVGGGNIYITENIRGFNYRGQWNSTNTYTSNDMVYTGNPAVAYLAFTTIAAGVVPGASATNGWARLGQRGTDGTDGAQGVAGADGDYTIWLFGRSAGTPNRPSSSDATYDAGTNTVTVNPSSIWEDGTIPSGNDPLWLSWIRVDPGGSPVLNFGRVIRLTGTKGDKGDPADNIQAEYSADNSSWHGTFGPNDLYIRFSFDGGSTWTSGIRFVGPQGMMGTPGVDAADLSFEFSADNSTWHTGNPNPGDVYIRFRSGSDPPTSGIRFVGRDGINGIDGDDTLMVQYSNVNNVVNYHGDLRASDEWIRFSTDGGTTWSNGIKFVGEDGNDAPDVIIQYSNVMVASRFTPNFVDGDTYIRFSSDGGTTWSPSATGVQFVGASGTIGGTGAKGDKGDKGDSQRVIFYRDSGSPPLGHAPNIPSGITVVSGRFTNLPTENGVPWDDDIPSGTGQLYAQQMEINNQTSTAHTIGVPYPAQGEQGEQGIPGAAAMRGDPGPRGLGQRAIFIRRTPAQGIPRTPDIASLAIDSNGVFTDLVDGTGGNALTWFINPPAAGSVSSDDVLYMQWLLIDGTTLTLLGTPIEAQGAQGLTGGFQITVFRRFASGSSILSPINVTYDYRTSTLNIGSWTVIPPSGTDPLYAQVMTIPPETTSLVNATLNGNPYLASVKGDPGAAGAIGPMGDKGDKGDPGVSGTDGSSYRLIYRESATEPSLPTGGSWDGTTFTPPANWTENSPNRTPGDPEELYATGVRLPGGGGSPHYAGVFKISGEDGAMGSRGPQGIRGDGNDLIFRIATTAPTAPANGSGTWNYETNTYSPPPDWLADPSSYTGNQNLYATEVTLPGSSNTEEYGSVFRLNGPPGPAGQRGAVGPRGNDGSGTGGNDGDSITFMFRASATPLTSIPTGGTWVRGTHTFTPPTDWYNTYAAAIAAVANQPVYGSTVYLSGTADTVSAYSHPIRLTGEQGPRGNPGSAGTPGAAGARGISSGFLYQRNTSVPTRPANGTGTYSNESITLTGWSTDTTAGTGILYGIGWIYNASGATAADRIKYTSVFQMEGPAGQAGAVGPMGTPGTGGMANDGSSVIFMFRTSSTVLRTIPTGGTWVRATNTFTPPANWYNTYADAENAGTAGDPVYASAVYLSGTADSINAYSHPIRMTGQQGPRGNPGIQGIQGNPGPKGDRGDRGIAGAPGKFTVPVFLWSTNQPSDPRPGRYDGGFISGLLDWSRDPPTSGSPGQRLWVANIEVNPVDNTTFLVNVLPWQGPAGSQGNPGPAGGIGPMGNPGTNGTNGLPGQSYVIIYRSSANVPPNPATGTLGTAGDPSTYSPPADWNTNVPSRTTTADIYQSYVTIPRTGTTLSATRALFLESRSTVPVSPPSSMSYPNGIEYGIASGQTPSATHLDSAAFSLAVNQSHTTALLTFPRTTVGNNNFYIRLPAGLSLTNAIESVDGEELNNWNKVSGQQIWIYTIGFEDSVNSFTFTVRRDT